MDEFGLIDHMVTRLGDRSAGAGVVLGPGDDAAVLTVRAGYEAVASIDTLVAGAHFPADAPPALVGYRALMVGLSDLAAMAATARYVLVALTLPDRDADWAGALADGMARAARETDCYICGGNLARGPLSMTVSVHGEVPAGAALTRSGARAGDLLQVSGALGGAAACVRTDHLAVQGELTPMQQRYYCPRARLDLAGTLLHSAHAAIDLSDGLLQDLSHLLSRSGVGAALESARIPVFPGAELADALQGGDDYELLVAAPEALPGFEIIGAMTDTPGLLLDGRAVSPRGYDHFAG